MTPLIKILGPLVVIAVEEIVRELSKDD